MGGHPLLPAVVAGKIAEGLAFARESGNNPLALAAYVGSEVRSCDVCHEDTCI